MSTRQVLDRIGTIREGLEVSWQEGVEVPPDVEPIAQSVLLEAIRNAEKHADPRELAVKVAIENGAFVLEVINDGVSSGEPTTGLGLRLATIEALQQSGIVEFGPLPPDRWHVRLVVPQEGAS
jgi:two-component sensor histidine kinase